MVKQKLGEHTIFIFTPQGLASGSFVGFGFDEKKLIALMDIFDLLSHEGSLLFRIALLSNEEPRLVVFIVIIIESQR